MTTLAEHSPEVVVGLKPPSLVFATLGFLGSTFLTAAIMVLLSAL
jgi:hypothetical protein